MAKDSDKEYKCPYCFQTSSRKYNINIHIQRKHHHLHPQINNTDQSPTYIEPRNIINLGKSSPYNWDKPMEQSSSSSAFFIPPPTFTFFPSSFFYDAEVRGEENERQSRRRFNKTLLEYMQNIVIPSLKLQYKQFHYTGRICNFPVFIDPKNMPKAHKIYRCPKCSNQILKPFFDFQEVHPTNKFIHNCYFFNREQPQKYKYNNEPQTMTLKLQEILLSILN
jgi:DNA-directed RNA polymerase subunit RPC12/RpoP